MNDLQSRPMLRRALALAMLAVALSCLVIFGVVPLASSMAERRDQIAQLRLQIDNANSIDGRKSSLSTSLEKAKSEFNEAGLYYKASSASAGAGLESAIVALLRQQSISVSQSRLQDDSAREALSSVLVTVSFVTSYASLISALKELSQLRPLAILDQIAIGQSSPGAVSGDTGKGPYRDDPILSVELTVRSVYSAETAAQ